MGDDESFWASHLGMIDRHGSRERRIFSLRHKGEKIGKPS